MDLYLACLHPQVASHSKHSVDDNHADYDEERLILCLTVSCGYVVNCQRRHDNQSQLQVVCSCL